MNRPFAIAGLPVVNVLVSLLVVTGAGAEGDARHRVRLTETSVTETGRLSTAPGVKVQTRGFGLGYVSPTGLGGALTSLSTYGDEAGTSIELAHRYLDASYTCGDVFLVTAGGGWGIGGGGSVTTPATGRVTADFKDGRSLFVGPGARLAWFEIYWIYRRNWVSYKAGPDAGGLASQHYQLGLGVSF